MLAEPPTCRKCRQLTDKLGRPRKPRGAFLFHKKAPNRAKQDNESKVTKSPMNVIVVGICWNATCFFLDLLTLRLLLALAQEKALG